MMKDMRGFSYFAILAGMVLVLCCFSTSAYASSDDERIIGVEPWFWDNLASQGFVFDPGYGGVLEYLLPPGREILPNTPRFNGAPPIEPFDIVAILNSYNLNYNFNYNRNYNLNYNSYGIEPSFDATSYSMEGPVVANPEPATVLLLGMGALALRRRKRA